MKSFKGQSYSNLKQLGEQALNPGSPIQETIDTSKSAESLDANRAPRLFLVSNTLPLHQRLNKDNGWDFEWDEDALLAQAKEGIDDDKWEVCFVGTLPHEVPEDAQEAVQIRLKRHYNCYPVFLPKDLRQLYYSSCCKQQLWPLFHYVMPMAPNSLGRFNADSWTAYVKVNMRFAPCILDVGLKPLRDLVWIHDYHLLILPYALRERVQNVRCGFFLHCPFPSSEIFRAFPRRREILRSMMNSDMLAFHTFDYARHFLSCCSRMLGLEHKTRRGALTMDYFGREVHIKVLPTGVTPRRILEGFSWGEMKWRLGEIQTQFAGKTVIIGVDDMDLFKGVELKLQAFDELLQTYEDYRGQVCLVQLINKPHAQGTEIDALKSFIDSEVKRINNKYGTEDYQPIHWIQRESVIPLHEKIAYYSIAKVAVVTATRDGMNLVPYEYVVCRQGAARAASMGEDSKEAHQLPSSSLVVSEFVGCSPSLSGAIRVNPWDYKSTVDGLNYALQLPLREQQSRHETHWRYVSSHTVAYWAQTLVNALASVTCDYKNLNTIKFGLGISQFKVVAYGKHFMPLINQWQKVVKQFLSSKKRLFLLDYDGTLIAKGKVNSAPSSETIKVLQGLTSNQANDVYIISGRKQTDLMEWLQNIPSLGLAAEHGYLVRYKNEEDWELDSQVGDLDWHSLVLPILQTYTQQTDGSYVEVKDSSFVWHYGDADPDFGAWQAKELLDHLDTVVGGGGVQVCKGKFIVEIKPNCVNKGRVVEKLLTRAGGGGETGGGGLGDYDFVLCVGDDRSDEDMFKILNRDNNDQQKVYACTVGQKPSSASYYIDTTVKVMQNLAALLDAQETGESGGELQSKDSTIGMQFINTQ